MPEITDSLPAQYAPGYQQDLIAELAASRVTAYLKEKAKPLEFERAGGVMLTKAQEDLLFADKIALKVLERVL